MPHDTQALLRALDEEPWLTLLALADACEEAGEDRLADGYRYLVKHRLGPTCLTPRGTYSWGFQGTHWTAYYLRVNLGRLRKGPRNYRLRFASASEACAAAAAVFGRILTPAERQALRRPPRPPSSAPAPAAAPAADPG